MERLRGLKRNIENDLKFYLNEFINLEQQIGYDKQRLKEKEAIIAKTERELSLVDSLLHLANQLKDREEER